MSNEKISANQNPGMLGQSVQITADQEQNQFGLLSGEPDTREAIEETLNGLKGANIAATIRACHGMRRGGYRITVKQDNEFNEIQVRLYENTIRHPTATGYVDRGHTTSDRFTAAEEVRGLVRAYLCK